MEAELRACRVCLATDGKLLDLVASNLTGIFSEVTGTPVERDGLPHHICYICRALLRKAAAFRANCRTMYNLLMSYRSTTQITTENLHNLNTSHQTLPLKIIHTMTVSLPGDLTDFNIKKEVTDDLKLDSRIIDDVDDFSDDNLDHDIFVTIEDVKSENPISINDAMTKETKNKVINDTKNPKLTDNYYKKLFNNYIRDKYIDKTMIIDKKSSIIDLLDSDDELIIKSKDINDLVASNTDSNKSIFYEFVKQKYINKKKPDEVKKIVNVMKLKMNKVKGKFKSSEDFAKFEETYDFEVVIMNKDEQILDLRARKDSEDYKKARYKCDICFQVYRWETILNNHKAAHSPDAGSHVCEICQLRFPAVRKLQHHQRVHRMKFICRQCNKQFNSSTVAKHHYKSHAGFEYSCEHCGKTFRKYASRVDHIRIHHGSTACGICYLGFRGALGLAGHTIKAHRQVYTCDVCQVVFDNSDALQRHATPDSCGTHLRPCCKCGQSFHSDELLTEHIEEQHPKTIKNKPNKPPPGTKRKCCNCSHKPPNNGTNISRNCPENSRDVPDGANVSRVCPCVTNPDSKCACATGNVDRPKRKKFMCEICAVSSFTSAAGLRYHQRIHTGEMPHECDVCHKRFRIKESLRLHERIHTGERPYQCSHCPKAFMSITGRRRHELVHTRHRRHQCHFCDKMFLTSTCVNTHVRTVHMKIPSPQRARNKKKNSYL